MSHVIPINDNWIFSRSDEPDFANQPISDGQAVTLPHTWNMEDGQGGHETYYRGSCWYQRSLQFSEDVLGNPIFLEIGAAGNSGRVYVNGQLAGESQCGYAMFRVPLSPYVRAGSNLISIQVDNSYRNNIFPLLADFTFYGGLYREVNLLIMDAVHFDVMDKGRDGIYLTQEKTGNDSFLLTARGRVINETGENKEATIRLCLQDGEGLTVMESEAKLLLEGETAFQLSNEVRQPILWDGIERPYLYTAVVSVESDGQTRDFRNIEIGFRTIEATTEQGLLLNGKPIKLNGVCRHQDFGGIGNAITKAHMELDMSLILEVGANSVRLAHYQHDDCFYTLCDRHGLLVWAEIPFISIPSSIDPENRNADDQLERLIKQAYNHPSIYGWGVQNEITIAVETEHTRSTIQRLVALAKQLDPHRMTVQANINGVEDDSIINTYTDLVGYNLYYGWYYGEIKDLGDRFDAFHNTNPSIPVILSEYGVDTNPKFHSYSPGVQDYTEEYQLLFHQNAIQTINARPYVLGGYVWNMFDFGSANRREGGETGKNLKGLVTIDRKLKKDAFYLYKAYWSKTPFVHVAGRRFVNRHQESNDFVILSNMRHISVYLNDELISTIDNDEPLKVVKDVSLSLGEHTLRAVGDDGSGTCCDDHIIVRRVEEADPAYVLPKKEGNEHVINWFEKFDLSDAEEIELKDGYYSTFDTIDDLFKDETAKSVFLKYFGQFTANPFFEATMNVMSIQKMSQLAFYNIPPELLTVIDRELNVIPKCNG